jgi:hypothetical protein
LNAARLIGTDFETGIHGAKLCVLGKCVRRVESPQEVFVARRRPPRRSADSDALVVMRQVLTVDGDEGDWW